MHGGVAAATLGPDMLCHKIRSALLATLLFAMTGPAVAQQPIDHSAEYDACILLANRAPEEALASARIWEEAAGGNAAR